MMIYRTGRKPYDDAAIRIGDELSGPMTREATFDAMDRLGVPGIASNMGKQQLLSIFIDWTEQNEAR